MNHTLTISDDTFNILVVLAQARGLTVDELLPLVVREVFNQPVGKPMEGEEFLRHLGADDDELNAPIEDDEPDA